MLVWAALVVGVAVARNIRRRRDSPQMILAQGAMALTLACFGVAVKLQIAGNPTSEAVGTLASCLGVGTICFIVYLFGSAKLHQ
jgi:hypothetical protein